MRVHPLGVRPWIRLTICATVVLALAGTLAGATAWCWTQAARMLWLHAPMALAPSDAARATWHLLAHGGWSDPARAFPTAAERQRVPSAGAYAAVAALAVTLGARGVWAVRVRVSRLQARSPLASEQRSLARLALQRGWVTTRTWARPRDLRRLWVRQPVPGRPYLGIAGRLPPRMLAAEPEIQPMVIAPPRAGKSSGFVVPWLLDHDGPALVLSTKRDIQQASIHRRRALGETWLYDPFGDEHSAVFTPLVPASSWAGAIRTGEALASAAHPDQANAANEFWDKEAASMLAPLLHAAALKDTGMGALLGWLDARDLDEPLQTLNAAGASAAADQLQGVGRRDERNRETTVMSALNLLRAYRHPQLTHGGEATLTPERFLNGRANTIYVVAAGHDQELLRPVILALLTAIYQAAILQARRDGPLQPRLLILMDEAANIAPVRNLASWLSQCGDHGIVIATIWQSIAQIDQRYGRAARDAICAACTAQLFIPPLAEPTSTGYLSELIGQEPVANTTRNGATQSLAIAHQRAAPAPWLRQIPRGRAILIYRELAPAVVRAPGWFEDPRFARYRHELTATGQAHPGTRT